MRGRTPIEESKTDCIGPYMTITILDPLDNSAITHSYPSVDPQARGSFMSIYLEPYRNLNFCQDAFSGCVIRIISALPAKRSAALWATQVRRGKRAHGFV